MSCKVPFSPPDIGEKEIENVVQVLRSGWITTGPQTKLFEKRIAEYCHTEKAVCLNSATAALELTLRVLGIGPGDEVITCAYTYTASASVVCHVGATLRLVDVAPGSFHMDYDRLEAAITEKTKAIIPVDIAGIPCDYDRLFDIVERKKALFRPSNPLQEAYGRVLLVTDCAHGLGSAYHGQPTGSLADFTTFSFHAVKNLTTGEGGAVTWRNVPGVDNEEIYRRYMLLSLHGQSKDALAKTQIGAWEYDIVTPAYKCNMTDIMAAIGLAQLERYPKLLERRREIAEQYTYGLQGCPVELLPLERVEYRSNWHLYLVRLNGCGVEQRNAVIRRLAEREIAANVHYKPLPLLSAYKKLGFDMEDYPQAYRMYQNEITLPLHTLLTNEDVAYVLENFSEALAGF